MLEPPPPTAAAPTAEISAIELADLMDTAREVLCLQPGIFVIDGRTVQLGHAGTLKSNKSPLEEGGRP